MTDRDEWLAWRRGGIGGSDIAGILGLSPWASPWSVWADKLGLLPPEPESEVMSAGRWLEAAIGPWFEAETGLTVAGEQTWCTCAEHSWHRATPDGFVAESQRQVDLLDALGLLEIKVLGPGRKWEFIPPHYQAQGQWQMHVTGHEQVWFAVLMGRRLDIHELARDQADIDYMVEAADRFWHDYVATGTPPPTDGNDATLRAIAAVYPSHTPGLAVEASDDLCVTVGAWRAAKAAERAARDEGKVHAAEITAALGIAEELAVEGRRAVSWRTQTRTTRCAHCGHAKTSEFRVLRDHHMKGTP